MTEIKSVLSADEEILWQGKPEELDEEKYITIEIPFFYLLLLFVILVYSIIASFSHSAISWVPFLAGLGLFVTIALFYILKREIRAFREKILYPPQYVLTNKRLIEKNIDVLRVDLSNAPPEFFEVKEDMVFIDLKGLKRFEVECLKKFYSIRFYLDANKKGFSWISFLYINDFRGFKSHLCELLPFKCILKKKKKAIYLKL